MKVEHCNGAIKDWWIRTVSLTLPKIRSRERMLTGCQISFFQTSWKHCRLRQHCPNASSFSLAENGTAFTSDRLISLTRRPILVWILNQIFITLNTTFSSRFARGTALAGTAHIHLLSSAPHSTRHNLCSSQFSSTPACRSILGGRCSTLVI